MNCSDHQLLALNRAGFIPGPGESEEQFLERAQAPRGDAVPSEWVSLHLQELFDFQPVSLPVFYSNISLTPWQGAAVWIEGRRVAKVQLREGLKTGSYLGLYNRDEIWAHEAVHAARCAFEESAYEEFFAYMTSQKKWRRVLGPIVRRPWEVWPLLVSALLGAWMPEFYWVTTLWMGAGFFRLIRQHKQLHRAALALGRGPKEARAILLRLTDAEIKRLARTKSLKPQGDLRWRLLHLAYGFSVE